MAASPRPETRPPPPRTPPKRAAETKGGAVRLAVIALRRSASVKTRSPR